MIIAYAYSVSTETTTGIILQTDVAEMNAIKERLIYHKNSTDHRLLLRTVIVELSLSTCVKDLWEAKLDIMDVEHNTGQHTWANYLPKDEKPKSDVELSRVSHGLRIQIAVACRRVEVISIWIEHLLESLKEEHTYDKDGSVILQWLQNMNMQIKMIKLDVDLLAKRAENQVGAVGKADYSFPVYRLCVYLL